MIRKFNFVEKEIYHIFNRGVEKRKIFLDKEDFLRFVISIILLNDQDVHSLNLKRFNLKKAKRRSSRKPLVEILAFCLMPNHFHFVLKQIAPNGIIRFLHRVETAHAKYFNTKYKRSGHLFQGTFKAKHVNENNYYMHLPLYIHLNPLDLASNKYKKSTKKAINFIETYPWSSLKFFITGETFPHLNTKEYQEVYSSLKEWEDAFLDWIPRRQELKEIIF